MPERAERSVCLLCGSAACAALPAVVDYEHGIPGQWPVVQCGRCGFVFIWPAPREEEIPSFYPSQYYSYSGGGSIDWLYQMVYALDAKRIKRLIGARGKILDVGCGSGDALKRMRDFGDYELWGLEIDRGAAQQARANGLAVIEGGITDPGFDQRNFNLIRMAHVIEHMLDPKAALRRAFDLLAPGGILMGETPNTACWEFKLFKQYWGGYQGPRHLAIFNLKNLAKALAEIGFVEIKMAPRLRTVGWSGSLQNLLVAKFKLAVPPNGRVRWYLLLILPFLPVTFIQSLFGGTATMAFMARRPR
jgi:SAM-dependent methyltransferase